jgi:hypothetical protein
MSSQRSRGFAIRVHTPHRQSEKRKKGMIKTNLKEQRETSVAKSPKIDTFERDAT